MKFIELKVLASGYNADELIGDIQNGYIEDYTPKGLAGAAKLHGLMESYYSTEKEVLTGERTIISTDDITSIECCYLFDAKSVSLIRLKNDCLYSTQDGFIEMPVPESAYDDMNGSFWFIGTKETHEALSNDYLQVKKTSRFIIVEETYNQIKEILLGGKD